MGLGGERQDVFSFVSRPLAPVVFLSGRFICVVEGRDN